MSTKNEESHLLDEEYWAQKDKEFEELYPDCPKAKPIECLNLIMKKTFAEQIANGEKKLELRAFSQHYYDRLIDKDVVNYVAAHEGDEKFQEYLPCVNEIRPVKKIHYHNYNNSWFLDVECKKTNIRFAAKMDAEYLYKEYGCDELLRLSRDLDAKKEEYRPCFFVFLVGKVLDTNLNT